MLTGDAVALRIETGSRRAGGLEHLDGRAAGQGARWDRRSRARGRDGRVSKGRAREVAAPGTDFVRRIRLLVEHDDLDDLLVQAVLAQTADDEVDVVCGYRPWAGHRVEWHRCTRDGGLVMVVSVPATGGSKGQHSSCRRDSRPSSINEAMAWAGALSLPTSLVDRGSGLLDDEDHHELAHRAQRVRHRAGDSGQCQRRTHHSHPDNEEYRGPPRCCAASSPSNRALHDGLLQTLTALRDQMCMHDKHLGKLRLFD